MRSLRVKLAVGVAVAGAAVTTAAAVAGDRGKLRTTLTGYEEVPAVSTTGGGTFKASLGRTEIRYELRYGGLEGGAVQQAHIHFGQEGVNGGISAFLCSNLGNGPAGTQACPQSGEIEGTITAAQVTGPAVQGIEGGSFDELARALRAGVAYVNVHTERWPGGEIRGQLDDHDRGRHGDD